MGGILNVLDCYDKRWPPWTSHITIELFSSSPPTRSKPSFLRTYLPSLLRSSESDPHFVRLRYNGRTLKPRACLAEGAHRQTKEKKGQNGSTDGVEKGDFMCTWEAFAEVVKGVEMKAEEWEAACRGDVKEAEKVVKTTKREG